jgi:hypothetical protein
MTYCYSGPLASIHRAKQAYQKSMCIAFVATVCLFGVISFLIVLVAAQQEHVEFAIGEETVAFPTFTSERPDAIDMVFSSYGGWDYDNATEPPGREDGIEIGRHTIASEKFTIGGPDRTFEVGLYSQEDYLGRLLNKGLMRRGAISSVGGGVNVDSLLSTTGDVESSTTGYCNVKFRKPPIIALPKYFYAPWITTQLPDTIFVKGAIVIYADKRVDFMLSEVVPSLFAIREMILFNLRLGHYSPPEDETGRPLGIKVSYRALITQYGEISITVTHLPSDDSLKYPRNTIAITLID